MFTSGISRTYGVELLSKKPMTIESDRLLKYLRHHCGEVDVPKEGNSFFFRDYAVDYADGSVSASVVMLQMEKFPDLGKYETSFQQSWSWREARATVELCQHSIFITDMMASRLPHKERMKLFHGVLLSFLSVVECDAIHWRESQQFMQPSRYKRARGKDPSDLLIGAFNVRLFKLQDRPGELVMDSLGLSALGVPDVQCHFKNLHPDEIANVLYNIGYYLFENGDIIKDGETVPGVQPTDLWECQHETAFFGPKREVLDINPDKPHAGANR